MAGGSSRFSPGMAKLNTGYPVPFCVSFCFCARLLVIYGTMVLAAFSAWMMAIQYCDYPGYDNHKIIFSGYVSMGTSPQKPLATFPLFFLAAGYILLSRVNA